MSNWGLTVDLHHFYLLRQSLRGAFEDPYLSKLVYLLDHSSEQRAHALIDQTLHVVNGLLVRQVQSELILHLMAHKGLVTLRRYEPDR